MQLGYGLVVLVVHGGEAANNKTFRKYSACNLQSSCEILFLGAESSGLKLLLSVFHIVMRIVARHYIHLNVATLI